MDAMQSKAAVTRQPIPHVIPYRELCIRHHELRRRRTMGEWYDTHTVSNVKVSPCT